ncbi:beta-glucanase [Kitasatospora sp. NPDC050543]|uniref:beta-glucanase n=1 Tax=Kitasatospora sp. NPDC050543 TaxID=3364054 RepID=UPI0037926441
MVPRHIWLATALAALSAAAPAQDNWVDTPYGRTTVAFSDSFQRLELGPGRTWGWQTGAYADCVSNPADFKLDRLTPDALSASGGRLTVTATPADGDSWNTGLITTGDSCDSGGNGAQVRTGDLLLALVRLPDTDNGAWPALWTWRDGRNEVDVFEWHADRPDTLEFVNQVHSSTGHYSSPDIGPGRLLYVGVRLGSDNTTWYLGTAPDRLAAVYADHTGVGDDFAAFPILSLSVNNGMYHAAPTTAEPSTLGVDEITIYRPAPANLPNA